MDQGKINVSVCMITYNHEAYIRQAIEGVLLQKSSYRMELVIGEDCSDDNTRKICSEYAEKYYGIIKLITSGTNKGMVSNFIKTIKECSGQYIAFCEGDDYWTDPFKIQKQVDFLESNPDYGMVHTGFQWFFSDNHKEQISNVNIPSGDIYEDFLIRSFIGNLTTVTRRNLTDDYLNNYKDLVISWAFYDRPLWLYIAGRSKVGYINEVTAVYRRHEKAMTSYNSVESEFKFFLASYRIRFFFMENYKEPSEKTRMKVLENYNRGLLEYNSRLFNKKNSKEAFKYLRQNKLTTLKDCITLLSSTGPVGRKLSSFIMFLVYGKKEFVRQLIIPSR